MVAKRKCFVFGDNFLACANCQFQRVYVGLKPTQNNTDIMIRWKAALKSFNFIGLQLLQYALGKQKNLTSIINHPKQNIQVKVGLRKNEKRTNKQQNSHTIPCHTIPCQLWLSSNVDFLYFNITLKSKMPSHKDQSTWPSFSNDLLMYSSVTQGPCQCLDIGVFLQLLMLRP